MLKKATHDSATGEKSASIWRAATILFARTQSKTLLEQYEAGCRIFDIRVKEYADGWHCAHGIWKTKKTVDELLAELNKPYASKEDQVKIVVTYEGKCKDSKREEMYAHILEKVHEWKAIYANIAFGAISFKYGKNSGLLKVDYDYLESAPKGWLECGSVSRFVKLDFKSWPAWTFIIIPRFWKWLVDKSQELKTANKLSWTYSRMKWYWKWVDEHYTVFSEDYYTYVDFL